MFGGRTCLANLCLRNVTISDSFVAPILSIASIKAMTSSSCRPLHFYVIFGLYTLSLELTDRQRSRYFND